MSPSTRLSELAKQDLVELYAWYEIEGGKTLADRFRSAVTQTLADLESTPHMGRLWLSRSAKTVGLRKQTISKPFHKNLLFY